jgi:hypothetical protein
MQSRTFSKFISSRLTPVKFGFDFCRGVASLAILLALAVTGDTAQAQVYNPAPPTEQPSQKNPASRAGGDAQNRNRAHDDKYWGITDANRRWFQIPYSRIPDSAAAVRGSGRLVADGWQFPRLASQDQNRRGIDFGGGPAGTIPADGAPVAGDGVRYFAAPWVTVSGPSTIALGNDGVDNEYQRTPAVPRLATTIPEDTINTGNPPLYPTSTVKWFPNIGGGVNTIRRFSIRIYLPTPEPFPTDGSLASETRVEDARYVVYFNRPRAANDPEPPSQRYVTRRRILLRAQSASGWFTLTDSNEQPLLFPMVTEATAVALNFSAAQRPRVELDNTTAGDTGSRFIIADQIQFVPASEYGEIKAPTTVTPIHGGRKVAPTALGNPFDPANQLFQPVWTDEPRTNPFVPVANGPQGLINDSFAFINNPRDINHPDNPEAGTADGIYTNTALTNYQPFEPWNPSTLFQGPRSLIDDQTGATIGTVTYNNGVPPVLRTNQERYEINDPDFGVLPRPLFSHMQVLVPRTEYVPDPNSADGLGSIAVGCVYGVDWLTGTPIWRFPDRTFLPRANTGDPGTVGTYEDQYGNRVIRSGARNPNQTINGVIVPTVPGIGAYDKNLDGYISDEEVYIVGQGGNPSGGIDAGITIAPRMLTRGRSEGTTIPVYNDAWNPYSSPTPGPGFTSTETNATSIVGVVDVPVGRYSGPEDDANGFDRPVEAGVAFVASNNGVIYAIDPYGNNDNRYYNFQESGTPNTARFGTYRPGSTNAFWTFSVTAPVRRRNESNEEYNLRLKQSVPATGSWGRSSPVIAYAKEDTDPTLNRFTQEPRLFIGNSNGVLYAINAVADAGVLVETPPPMPSLQYDLRPFPFRKETHLEPNASGRVPDLRWWFETQGPITAAPAVSASVHPRSPADATPESKGVYVTSNDGRVYSLDWNGPVTKGNHNANLNYTGTTADDRRASAEALNDNFRFHNSSATSEFARADGTEGTIRPRWVFPSRYRDIDGNDDNSELAPIQPADFSAVFPNSRVERQARLAPINSAPSLMDYPFREEATGPTVIKRYVAVVANDLNGSDAPIRGRVYLLDQVGDRRDFSVKPVERPAVAGNPSVAFGQPDDMYAPTEYVFSDATPAWTYRPVYKRYQDAGVNEIRQFRNRPTQLVSVPTPLGTGTADDPAATNGAGAGLAEKRELPTLFVGGRQGRLFALDIDPQTGLFLRWRDTIGATRAYIPLPDSFTQANVPVNEPLARRLDPPSPVLNAITVGPTTLNARPPLVRTIQGLNAEDVSSIVVSGGPQQNRNHPYAATPTPVNGPTVPPLPTNDTPSWQYPGVPYVLSTGAPIVPVTGVRPPYWNEQNVIAAGAGTALDFAPFPLVEVPSFDLVGRFVNQEHDDPAATTGGNFPNPNRAVVGQSLVLNAPAENRAYQYPTLAVTMSNGLFSLVSTEIDGLDSAASQQGTDVELELGWAYASDPVIGSAIRPLLMSFFGPGGPGTSVAIVTNAQYGAMDPGFRNNVRKLNTDLSATNFPYYPWNEPRNQGPVDAAPYDDPRPRFEPRSLYSGNTANPAGPDGDINSGDGWPEIKADAHTGKTGFPLDLRGLFYDKRFAANTTDNNTNDDGLLRLPAYTGIGEALPDGERRGRNTLTTPYTAPGDVEAIAVAARYTPILDGTPDVARDSSTGATSPYRTDPFKLFAGTIDPGDDFIKPEADINAPGTNITWMFVGGSDGVFYSYTPNRYSVPGFGRDSAPDRRRTGQQQPQA